MGRVKRNSAFEHSQSTQIQIHPAHAQSLIRTFALIYAFCSVWSDSKLFANQPAVVRCIIRLQNGLAQILWQVWEGDKMAKYLGVNMVVTVQWVKTQIRRWRTRLHCLSHIQQYKAHKQVVEWTLCFKFRTSILRNYGVPIVMVNTVRYTLLTTHPSILDTPTCFKKDYFYFLQKYIIWNFDGELVLRLNNISLFSLFQLVGAWVQMTVIG